MSFRSENYLDAERRRIWQERQALLADNKRLRKALAAVCAPPSLDAFLDDTGTELGRLFAVRVEIAARALANQPFNDLLPRPDDSHETDAAEKQNPSECSGLPATQGDPVG